MLAPQQLLSGFNTQPPEGGCDLGQQTMARCSCFNTQPPEGGWHYDLHFRAVYDDVSTHSRPKAAGTVAVTSECDLDLFQHTAARRRLGRASLSI